MLKIEEKGNTIRSDRRSHTALVESIPWNDFIVGKSVFVPYDQLTNFRDTLDALMYLRPTARYKGLRLGFRFSVTNCPERSAVEINCKEEAYRVETKFAIKKKARLKALLESESRSDRYRRSESNVDTYLSSRDPNYVREVIKVFNEYESQLDNPHLIKTAETTEKKSPWLTAVFDAEDYEPNQSEEIVKPVKRGLHEGW